MVSASASGRKGLDAEERLRAYFLDAGYYVVRGISLVEGNVEVTDVDLWLYLRASALHRTRANVDIKSRTRSKAMERILWAKGMQLVLRVDEAIVATQDKRPAVKDFAQRSGVKLLDGNFLTRLGARDVGTSLTEEDLSQRIDADGMDRVRGAWKERLVKSRSRLLTNLDFDGCNHWLSETGFFLRKFAAGERQQAALRLFYMNLSYFCLGLDFRSRTFAFETEETRQKALLNGLRFGERNMREVESLVKAIAPGAEANLIALAEQGRENILADYFAGKTGAAVLFATAKKLERAAYAPIAPFPSELESDSKAIVALVADYNETSRTLLFGPPATEKV